MKSSTKGIHYCIIFYYNSIWTKNGRTIIKTTNIEKFVQIQMVYKPCRCNSSLLAQLVSPPDLSPHWYSILWLAGVTTIQLSQKKASFLQEWVASYSRNEFNPHRVHVAYLREEKKCHLSIQRFVLSKFSLAFMQIMANIAYKKYLKCSLSMSCFFVGLLWNKTDCFFVYLSPFSPVVKS